MNMYKIIYPLLECRSWLLFVLFFCEEEFMFLVILMAEMFF